MKTRPLLLAFLAGGLLTAAISVLVGDALAGPSGAVVRCETWTVPLHDRTTEGERAVATHAQNMQQVLQQMTAQGHEPVYTESFPVFAEGGTRPTARTGVTCFAPDS